MPHMHEKCFPLALASLHKKNQAVLIRSGQEDEAHAYVAELVATIFPDKFVVYFHETAQFLERIKLFGQKEVLIDCDDETRFVGTIALIHDEIIPQQASHCGLILKIHEQVSKKNEQQLFLLT